MIEPKCKEPDIDWERFDLLDTEGKQQWLDDNEELWKAELKRLRDATDSMCDEKLARLIRERWSNYHKQLREERLQIRVIHEAIRPIRDEIMRYLTCILLLVFITTCAVISNTPALSWWPF
jgi:hypothetical protein